MEDRGLQTGLQHSAMRLDRRAGSRWALYTTWGKGFKQRMSRKIGISKNTSLAAKWRMSRTREGRKAAAVVQVRNDRGLDQERAVEMERGTETWDVFSRKNR